MSPIYDALVIGAGHNGLVAAAFLAKAGRRVLVLERRESLGGAAGTEELFPGFRFNTGAHDAGLFRSEIIKALGLDLDFIESPAILTALNADGSALTIWRDPLETVRELEKISPVDADAYSAFTAYVARMAEVLDGIMLQTPPDLANLKIIRLIPWLKLALKVRRMGRRDMMEFMRVLPMSVSELLDNWFESDVLKGALGTRGITGTMQGPRASGTGLMFLYGLLASNGNGVQGLRFVRGGMGRLPGALAAVAQRHGTVIRTGAGVERILVDQGVASGVALTNGEEIHARTLVSSAEPRHTLFDLVGARHLPVRMARRLKNLRLLGSTARVNLALNALPRFTGIQDDMRLSGHLLVSPSLDYLERAYDDAKYGQISGLPTLDIVIPSVLDHSLAPDGQHAMSVNVQYAPYDLRDGDWDEQREMLGERVMNLLAEYAPGIRDQVLHKQVITPLDLEREYGLTEGSIFHGQMALDQMLFMRPVAGAGSYQTPIENLFLCGAGSHPGGGVTGAPGYNAAREILRLRR